MSERFDILTLILFVLFYFRLMRWEFAPGIDPTSPNSEQIGPHLLNLPPLFSLGTLSRTVISLLPFWMSNTNGTNLNRHLFVCSLALTTIVAPLTDTFAPQPNPRKSLSEFVVHWFMARLQTGLLFSVIGFIAWLLLKIVPSASSFLKAIMEHSGLFGVFVSPNPEHLELPLHLYALLYIALLIRAGMLASKGWVYLGAGLLCGAQALNYFHNLTLIMPLSENNWEGPVVGGIAGGIIWALGVDTVWRVVSRFDERLAHRVTMKAK